MFSMTGFGKAEAVCHDFQLAAEISSVNRKQLELRMNLAPELSGLEARARAIVSACVTRGAVQLRVTLHAAVAGRARVEVDRGLLGKLIDECRIARENANLDGAVNVEALLALPGVVTTPPADTEEPEFLEAFDRVLAEACEKFNAMRRTEGEALRCDLEQRLALLEKLLDEIEPLCREIPENAKRRLLGKLAAERIQVPATDEQLLREVLFYADKADVTEEITRLRSHFVQFRNFFGAEQPSGRSLDFLVQESFREITTLGNKSGSAPVAVPLIAFKSELEKIREQVQNVE